MKKLLFLLLCLFTSVNVFYANDVEFIECKYSEEYIKWSELPENKKTLITKPNMCEITMTPKLYLKGSASNSYFNLAENGKVTSVKHQEDTNTCWAFSSLASIESNILMHNGATLDLSEAHMELAYQQDFQMGYPTYNRVIGQGGNAYVSSSYLLNGRGPVLETSYPFSKLIEIRSNKNKFSLDTYKSIKPYLSVGSSYIYNGDYVQTSKTCSANDINKIKSTLVNYGAVTSSLYMSSEYVDQTTGAYYYDESLNSNHAVTIVGWNDNYDFSDKNLKVKPTSKGAWIVKNSYGTSKFDKGYNYISYETKNICSIVNWYDNISILDSNKEYNNYYYDELYYNMAVSSKSNAVYMGSIYEKKSDKIEKLKQVKFASHISGYNYKVYFANNNNFSNAVLLGSGTIEETGYTSLNITQDINITSSKYSIIVLFTNNTSNVSIPLIAKTSSDSNYSNLEILSGVNYIGTFASPALWSDITNKYQAMLTTKVVTEVTDQSNVEIPEEEEPIIPEDPTLPDEPVEEPSNPIIPDEPIVEPNEPEIPDDDIPTYDEDEKKEPNSSNNEVVIKPNKDNDVSYIEKTEDNVDNPKTSDINGTLFFITITIVLLILIIGVKKFKRYNKM